MQDTVGSRIAKARQEAALSQEGLAYLVNVTRTAVNKWESSDSRPRPENLKRIAEHLGVAERWLWFGEEPMRTAPVTPGFGTQIGQLAEAAAAPPVRPQNDPFTNLVLVWESTLSALKAGEFGLAAKCAEIFVQHCLESEARRGDAPLAAGPES